MADVGYIVDVEDFSIRFFSIHMCGEFEGAGVPTPERKARCSERGQREL